MKKLLCITALLAFFAAMLLFPGAVITGAGQGLLLWFEVLLPTLLPFMMISRLLVKTGLAAVLSRFFHPFVGRLCGTTPQGSYCIMIGFLCGYPMGAKAIADLLEEGRLSLREAQYLLCFANNVSPGFVSGFVVNSCLSSRTFLLPAFLLLYGVPLAFSFPLRCVLLHRGTKKVSGQADLRTVRAASASGLSAGACPNALCPRRQPIVFEDLDDMIRSSLSSVGMLGGYVVIFRIFTQFLLLLPAQGHGLKKLLAGILEITSGIPIITANTSSAAHAFALVIACAAFGGLSGIAQTGGIIRPAGLSMRPYLISKALQALACGLLACLWTAHT